jgi:hypothetical protein
MRPAARNMPDPQTYLLPARAYVLSQRDQNLPMRRAALADAKGCFDATDKGGFTEHLALVALIGEALQIVEDLGALANSFFSAPEGTAFFAALTNYNARAINNFYSSLKNRPITDFLHLLGFEFAGFRVEDALDIEPPLTADERDALGQAHLATATLVRQHMLNLAGDWERYRRFHHAYKHGLIVVNPEDVRLVRDRTTSVPAICVWTRKRPMTIGYGQIEPPNEATADYMVALANIALDVLDHLVAARVRVFDLIDLRSDGTWAPKPLQGVPWLWWFDKNDLPQESRDIISRRFGISFS